MKVKSLQTIFAVILALLMGLLSTLLSSLFSSSDDSQQSNLGEAKRLPPRVKKQQFKFHMYDPMNDPDACERDYTFPCPDDFFVMPTEAGSSTRTCAPSYKYKGSCQSDPPNTGMTSQQKREWALKCKRNWPCITCRRNYSSTCPKDWKEIIPKGSPIIGCTAPSNYTGSCHIPAMGVSFQHFNKEMLETWSDNCKAYWPCITASGAPDFDSPIGLEATTYRISLGLQ